MGADPELSEVCGLTGRRRFIQAGAALAVTAAWRLAKAGSAVQTLLEDARSFLSSLRDAHLESFLKEWPDSRRQPTKLRALAPASLPVLRWISEARKQAPQWTAELVDDVVRAAPLLAWRQTYDASQVGAGFLENYGWAELLGLTGPLAGQRLACGLLLLGPSITYPSHRHEALEIYVPIAGTASWQQGDSPWRDRAPGTVIYHESEEPHAMRTGAQPLLALYLWRSENLNQKSRFDSRGGS